jgi:hypothetical protein
VCVWGKWGEGVLEGRGVGVHHAMCNAIKIREQLQLVLVLQVGRRMGGGGERQAERGVGVVILPLGAWWGQGYTNGMHVTHMYAASNCRHTYIVKSKRTLGKSSWCSPFTPSLHTSPVLAEHSP